ncbi:hypothetical protein IC582_005551 [Cucumis melo]
MDCSICSSLPVILRPPRNTICGSCYDGAKCVINLINKLQNDRKPTNDNVSPVSQIGSSCKASSFFFSISFQLLHFHICFSNYTLTFVFCYIMNLFDT